MPLKNAVLKPFDVEFGLTGLKYGELNAFSISARNSNAMLLCSRTRFTMLRSNLTRRGALTTSVRMPQSPNDGDVSRQSGPFAGAR